MKKKTVIPVMFVSMLLVIALYFISGTYARYTSSASGDASLDVAKWAVAIKSGEKALTNVSELTFKTDDNTDVVSGKIAPSVTVSTEVGIDLTGTEVSVDITAKIDEEKATKQLQEALRDSAEDIKVTVAANEGSFGSSPLTFNDGVATVSLPDKTAFTEENGKGTIKISITWTNTEEHNVSDTTAGTSAQTIKVPIILEVKQHIDPAPVI